MEDQLRAGGGALLISDQGLRRVYFDVDARCFDTVWPVRSTESVHDGQGAGGVAGIVRQQPDTTTAFTQPPGLLVWQQA
jgi:hypothetical protein